MLQEIKKFISEYDRGLFLLDSPTGFGKTTAVLNYLEEYIRGNIDIDKKRMFFITNLKINLPWNDLRNRLGDELFYENCLVLESYSDTVIRQWGKVGNIDLKLVRYSDEYMALNDDIDLLKAISDELEKTDINIDDRKRKVTLKKNLESKIQDKTEPKFREFIKSNYFYGKSVVEKNKFIKDHPWFSKLYPSSIMEKYKVVFLTTAKFFNPIDSFHRMPFFLADDGLLNNSVVFIDEFDATKDTVLSNIIQQDLKIQIDLVKLFLNIHYSFDNLSLPRRMLKVSDYLQKCIDDGKNYKTPEMLIDGIKSEFKNKYEQYKFSLSIKSEGLDKSKTFLFYDGKPFTIVKDNSRKNILAKEDKITNYIKLYSDQSKFGEGTTLKTLIGDLNYSINYFIRGLVYLADNFKNVKNQSLEKNDPQYTIEESIMSMLSVLNISNEFTSIIFQRAIEYYEGKELEYEVKLDEDSFMRKGFNFTEIEDDRYHDLQSKFRAIYFHTTPEDILIRMSNKANIVGVSATASLATVVGNYDINYLKKNLIDKYYPLSDEGRNRIHNKFYKQLEIYDREKIDIRVKIVDDINENSYEEKTLYIINNCLGLEETSKTELISNYNKYISEEKDGKNVETKKYYQFIKFKIGLCYKYFICDETIKSFLCFNNFTIKSNSSIKESELRDLFKIIAENNGKEYVRAVCVSADSFLQDFDLAKGKLSKGQKIFWISTYKTIGSGKNIQYEIPDVVLENVVLDGDKNRKDKDFDAIYLCTPTNLIQNLYFESDSRYEDLSKYLFQQEYLRQNNNLSYQAMKQYIIRGFKKIFYNIEDIYYPNNGDMLIHSAQIIIQALGRICRCRNKNKTIHILADAEVVDRLQRIKSIFEKSIYNKEFTTLLNKKITKPQMALEKYSKQNKKASNDIKWKSWMVRQSKENVREWQDIRDYVLKNPTANFVRWDLKNYYFEFSDECSGYSYHLDKNKDFDSLNYINRFDDNQVSDGDCCLSSLLDIPEILEEFNKNKYITKFKKGKYVMSPALYKQVYIGALGEIAGKIILEQQTGYEVKDLENYSHYELFDFQIGNAYFDFKHWDEFVVDHNKYCDKIRRKLKRVSGEKCFIVNLTIHKDTDYKCQNIGDNIFVIPYLIDPNTAQISKENIDFIIENLEN